MAYEIHFEERVIKRDIPSIPLANKEQIMRAIYERLTVAPLNYGKPLRHGLSGLRSLRVGDWRIGYCVEGGDVVIEHIELRRDAYKDW